VHVGCTHRVWALGKGKEGGLGRGGRDWGRKGDWRRQTSRIARSRKIFFHLKPTKEGVVVYNNLRKEGKTDSGKGEGGTRGEERCGNNSWGKLIAEIRQNCVFSRTSMRGSGLKREGRVDQR